MITGNGVRPGAKPLRICLVTTSQPAANPRLLKEADALADAGFSVRVVGAQWAEWAASFDTDIIGTRPWDCEILDWRRSVNPALFWKTRLRHYAARQLAKIPAIEPLVETAALWRVGPDLKALACRAHADLFIAHNIGALPAALEAGETFGAPVGFDAEDFQSGQLSRPEDRAAYVLTQTAERRYLPRCAYVTAAAPGIAEAYRDSCRIPLPVCVLNVFPMGERPPQYRPTDHRAPVRMHWFSQTIGPDRGLEDAVCAMGLLKAYPLELHLRGRWHGGYEERLRHLAAEHGVNAQQIVSYPPAPPETLVQLASEYDVGLALEWPVSVNNDILLSNKTFIYLLAGNAVIASRTRGQSWLVPQLGRAAMLSDPHRPDSFAAALRPWLEDRTRLDSARREAWRLAETRFNWDSEKTKFLEVVRTVLRPRLSSRELPSPDETHSPIAAIVEAQA